MLRRLFITFLVFALGGICVCFASVIAGADAGIGVLRPITQNSACPASGCALGVCHDYAALPEPDGIHELVCPEVGCASVECHVWDALTGHYHQASDASLNLWVLFPVLLVTGLVLFVKKAR